MRQLANISGTSKKYLALVVLFFSQSILWAQEKNVDVSLNVEEEGSTTWYTQPWMWIVGAAIFILILAAILRGKK